MNPSQSNHAKIRFRQRGISKEVIELVNQYGKPSNTRGGAIKLSLKRRDVNKIIEELKRCIHFFERARTIVLIEKDGTILTGYHRD